VERSVSRCSCTFFFLKSGADLPRYALTLRLAMTPRPILRRTRQEEREVEHERERVCARESVREWGEARCAASGEGDSGPRGWARVNLVTIINQCSPLSRSPLMQAAPVHTQRLGC
jgi:hypothetical protein